MVACDELFKTNEVLYKDRCDVPQCSDKLRGITLQVLMMCSSNALFKDSLRLSWDSGHTYSWVIVSMPNREIWSWRYTSHGQLSSACLHMDTSPRQCIRHLRADINQAILPGTLPPLSIMICIWAIPEPLESWDHKPWSVNLNWLAKL